MNYIEECEAKIAHALRTMIDKGNESEEHKKALKEYQEFKRQDALKDNTS